MYYVRFVCLLNILIYKDWLHTSFSFYFCLVIYFAFKETRSFILQQFPQSGFCWLHACGVIWHVPLSPLFPLQWWLDPGAWSDLGFVLFVFLQGYFTSASSLRRHINIWLSFFVMLIAVKNQCLDFPSFYKASCMTLFLIIKGKKWVSFVVINSIILVALCPMEMHWIVSGGLFLG